MAWDLGSLAVGFIAGWWISGMVRNAALSLLDAITVKSGAGYTQTRYWKR
jgi:hypothetical protein